MILMEMLSVKRLNKLMQHISYMIHYQMMIGIQK